MRLSPEQQRQILQLLRSSYGADCRAWVFGSRARDDALGGDLDLLVETSQPRPPTGSVSKRHQAALAIEHIMDDLSVDLLVRYQDEEEQPLQSLAKQQGVRLDG